MENLFDTALSNPIYLAILAIIFILLLYAIIKKIIKLVISFGIILIVYVLYLNYTGQEVPKTVEDLKKSVSAAGIYYRYFPCQKFGATGWHIPTVF